MLKRVLLISTKTFSSAQNELISHSVIRKQINTESTWSLFTSFHFISLHFKIVSLHFTSFHFISLGFASFHLVSLHFTSFQICFTSLPFHFISSLFHCISLHFQFVSLRFTSPHFISNLFRFIALSLHFPLSHFILLYFSSFHVVKFASLYFTLFYFIFLFPSPPSLDHFEAFSLLASNSALHLLSVCHTISSNGPPSQ